MVKDALNQKVQVFIEKEKRSILKRAKKDAILVVAASSASIIDQNSYIGTNGKAKESDYDCRLIKRIKSRFTGKTIGDKTPLEPWPLGQCAEQHAANTVLINNAAAIIDDIQFSDAIKFKTGLIRNYCNNCKSIFDQLN